LILAVFKFTFVEAATFQTAANTNTAYPSIPKLPVHLKQADVQAAFQLGWSFMFGKLPFKYPINKGYLKA